MKKEDVQQLIDKYMDGTTTVAEEQLLRDFFSQRSLILPKEWQPLQALFAWEQHQRGEKTKQRQDKMGKSARKVPLWVTRALSTAAIVAILVVLGQHFFFANKNYAMVNGVRTTNKEVVQYEAEAALEMVSTDGSEDFSALLMMGDNENEK